MLTNQKHLFQLPDDIHYLNGAYMSPLLKSVEDAGIEGLIRKRNPASIKPVDFFTEAEHVKTKFGQLINAPATQIAIIPSASYGLKAAVQNLPLDNGQVAVTVAHEFPSGYYTLRNWCQTNHKTLKVVEPPDTPTGRAKGWGEKILEAITPDTAVVLLSSVHWMDGARFDLQAIGARCKEVDALLIVDGTQSVGALPMDVQAYHIDALVCAGYKWLLGPYSSGYAYYSPSFNAGIPLEDTWMNKANAQDFTNLTAYVDTYKPGAGRYDAGEFGNFIQLPMAHAALSQILEWSVPGIQEYCSGLIQPLVQFLLEKNCVVEEEAYRSSHLFGIRLPKDFNSLKLTEELQKRKIMVSLRGNSVRVSPHVYNTEHDIAALMAALSDLLP